MLPTGMFRRRSFMDPHRTVAVSWLWLSYEPWVNLTSPPYRPAPPAKQGSKAVPRASGLSTLGIMRRQAPPHRRKARLLKRKPRHTRGRPHSSLKGSPGTPRHIKVEKLRLGMIPGVLLACLKTGWAAQASWAMGLQVQLLDKKGNEVRRRLIKMLSKAVEDAGTRGGD